MGPVKEENFRLNIQSINPTLKTIFFCKKFHSNSFHHLPINFQKSRYFCYIFKIGLKFFRIKVLIHFNHQRTVDYLAIF